MLVFPIGGCAEKQPEQPTEEKTEPYFIGGGELQTEDDAPSRDVNSDGSITMHYNTRSEISDSFMQIFVFGEECTRVEASCTGGTLAKIDKDLSADFRFEPCNSMTNDSNLLCWTPQEMSGGSCVANGCEADSVVSFTVYSGDAVAAEGEIRIAFAAGELDGDYTFSMDGFTLTLGDEDIAQIHVS